MKVVHRARRRAMESQLVTEWFANPQWWFDADHNTDLYLSRSFGQLLDSTDYPEGSADPEGLVHQIILYDQIPHHVYRAQYASHVICFFLQKALRAAHALRALCSMRDVRKWCFALLPFRHSKQESATLDVMSMCWKRLRDNEDDNRALKRFIRATYARADIRRTCDYVPNSTFDELNSMGIFKHPADMKKPLAWTDDILTDGFKKNMGPCIVSLSGGVDSMVCSYILAKTAMGAVAVHINYCNRPTSDQEQAFVQAWCKRINIPLHVRRITEINRKAAMIHEMRDVYESYTRNVRYSTYKAAWSSASHASHASDVPVVVLGHNADDTLENILTNIANGTKYENLCGMEADSYQDGVQFFRPMLGVAKADIIRYAIEHNIPFLNDSTPKWSQRGKIRDIVRPALQAWDPRFIDGLFKASGAVQDLHRLADMVAHGMFTRLDAKMTLLCSPYELANATTIVWRQFFKKCGLVPQPSHKSLAQMQIRIAKPQIAACTIVLTKLAKMHIKHDGSGMLSLQMVQADSSYTP